MYLEAYVAANASQRMRRGQVCVWAGERRKIFTYVHIYIHIKEDGMGWDGRGGVGRGDHVMAASDKDARRMGRA
jgi:hypothetical protein